jgi:hypothetical protein
MSGKFVEIALQRAQQTEYLKRRLVDAEAENQQLRDALASICRIEIDHGSASAPNPYALAVEIAEAALAAVRVEER